MRVDSVDLLLFLGCACVAICVGSALRQSARTVMLGWIFLSGGLVASALLALASLTGRLGPEHLWFREPTFYIAALIYLCAFTWWLTRPLPAALRFGLPTVLLLLLGVTMVLARLDGRSAPMSMLMPTGSQPAPDLSYFDASGGVRHLSELRGKVVLVNFWATWCAPCRREMPMLSRMQREHAKEGLVVLYLSLEDPAVLRSFLAINRFDGVQGRIDGAPEFYNAGKFYPLSYLISRDGRVIRRWSGRPKEDWLRTGIALALR